MNFIICEDEKVLASHYKQTIEKFMMNYDVEYTISQFDGYNEEFKRLAKKEIGQKVYFLDVKTNCGTGINAARMIREELDDWISMIIIITSYPEYRYDVIGKRLMLLDFINKLEKPDKRIVEDLKICMKNFDNKQNTLRFKYKGTVYNLHLKDIIYIEKEQDSKRCIIHTKNDNYYILGTLNEILKKLDNRFIKTHRSLVVNTDHVDYFKQSTNELYFKNKEKTYLVSRSNKKEVTSNVRYID